MSSYFLNTYIFHWLPEKAIWIGGHTLSWDARCSGIYIGFGIGLLYHFLTGKKVKKLPPAPILFSVSLMFLPLFIDVFTIKWAVRVPSNDIRYLTGLFFGTAFSIYLYPVFITLASSWPNDSCAIGSLTRFAAILTLVLCSFILKSWDNLIAYLMLEGLAFIGFSSLFGMLSWSVFRIIRVKKMNNGLFCSLNPRRRRKPTGAADQQAHGGNAEAVGSGFISSSYPILTL